MYNGQMETDPTTQPEEKECLMRIGPRKYTEHTLSDHLHPPATEQARAQGLQAGSTGSNSGSVLCQRDDPE